MFTKYQIALQYFPELENNSILAVRRLRMMIDRCKELKEVLDSMGLKRYNKTFTPQQVKLIYYFLGDPQFCCSDTTLADKYILSDEDYKMINHYLNNRNRTWKDSETH